jgi:hypothetical protein
MAQGSRHSAWILTKAAGLGAALLLSALAAQGARQQQTQCTPLCAVPQSPRNIDPREPVYNGHSTVSMLSQVTDDSLRYTYSCDGHPVTIPLYRCSLHYHCPIENVQGCPGDAAPPVACTENPAAGQWIEVHTVYAARVTPWGQCPDTQGLGCCLEGPFVVRGYSATVAAQGTPIVARQLAEWSGSDTAVTDQCRDLPAQWSFPLGCGFRVGLLQLAGLKAKAPRQLQGGLRVSRDLTLVEP